MSSIGVLGGDSTWKSYVQSVTKETPKAIDKDRHDPLEDVDESEKEIDRLENRSDSELLHDAKPIARMIALGIDNVQAGILATISGDDMDKYKLSKTEQVDYAEIWAEYLKTKDELFTPGQALLFASLCLFVPKVPVALKARKEKKLLKHGDEQQ